MYVHQKKINIWRLVLLIESSQVPKDTATDKNIHLQVYRLVVISINVKPSESVWFVQYRVHVFVHTCLNAIQWQKLWAIFMQFKTLLVSYPWKLVDWTDHRNMTKKSWNRRKHQTKIFLTGYLTYKYYI